MSRRNGLVKSLKILFVAVVLATSHAALAAGSGDFKPHPTTPSFGTGATTGMVVGDIDGDGDLDIIAINQGGEAATVWLNDGAGNFSAHPTTPSLSAANGLSAALGDIDGDGDLDLVIANGNNAAETVWLNNGAGSFSPHPTAPSFGVGSSTWIALGDIDGDGDLDAVVANTDGQATTVWLNNGAGVFTPHPVVNSYAGGGNSQSVMLGDLDGDGDADVVIGNLSGPETVWLNDGAGVFAPHPTTPSFEAGGVAALSTGDIDGDGDRDVVTVNGNAGASVWRNNGLGSFSAHPTTPTFGAGTSMVSLALGDIDGDGDLDLVIGAAGTGATVWLNDGAGTFSAHPVTPSFGASQAFEVILRDFDGDGNLDVVLGNLSGQAETVWLNQPTFAIATAVAPVGAGTVTCVPNPVAQSGSSTCTATANAGFTFANWSGDCIGATCTLTNVTAAKSVTANFTANTYAIATAASPVAGGTVTCTPNPVSHGSGSTCTATPNAGYTFSTWSGDCTGASCTLAGVTSAQTVTANFTLNTYAIATAASPPAGGTVTCTPNPVNHDGTSICTGTPNVGYTLANWSGDCSGGSCTLSNVTSAKSVTANFVLVTYPIATAANPPAGGIATCVPNPVSHGSSSTCTATPNAGFALANWSGDCTGATCTLTNVTSAKSVTANFSNITYTVTTAVSPAGSGTVSCTPNPVGHAGSSTCTANPNAGFALANWSGDCTGATCTLTNVTAAKSVTANFSAVTYNVTTAVSPAGSGTVSCTPNPVGHAGSSTCTATANAGFVFTTWSGDCTGSTCSLSNVTAAKSVTATFAAVNRTYSGASATGTGTITATFTGGGAACTYATAQFIAAPPGSAPVPPTAPADTVFPHGLFDFTTSGCTPGSTITMTITYPAPLPAGYVYWKYGPEPGNTTAHWYVMPATISGNTATFSITDGSQGDDDLAANGTIVDQGGPGSGPGATAVQTPTLSEWAMLLMALAMFGLARRRLRPESGGSRTGDR